jgi:hypothetical protein
VYAMDGVTKNNTTEDTKQWSEAMKANGITTSGSSSKSMPRVLYIIFYVLLLGLILLLAR